MFENDEIKNNDFLKESIVETEKSTDENIESTSANTEDTLNAKAETKNEEFDVEIVDELPYEKALIFSRDIDTNNPYIKESIASKLKRSKGKLWRYTAAVVCGMFAGAIIFGGAIAYTSKNGTSGFWLQQNSGANANKGAITTDASSIPSGTELNVTQIAYKVSPSVVGIVNNQTINTWYGQAQQNGSGSGIIISQDGYIITNSHVIEGANSLKVVLNDGQEVAAKVIGIDDKTDIAVIKIDKTGLPAAELGKSSELQVGELAVAIGNPLGIEFQGSVTAGIISALNRTMTVDGRTYTLVQTDAAINPGNSGGPLVNKYGQVIGINTVKISSSECEGMGFAIPIDIVTPIVQELINNGYVTGRPQIGVGTRDISENMAKYYNMPVGVYIATVAEGSGAEAAGLKVGDVIIKADDKTVTTTEELNKIKNSYKAGDTINLTIVRSGNTTTVGVKLGEEKSSK